ncbi:NIPSNAP family protein [Plantactinospora sp. WMMC1484]|uniref:NIPSNAP family protein n=1 Tax=Plantactinospora sp. WMMC1484 TaxID=3404122 RepID=UPI003BF54626
MTDGIRHPIVELRQYTLHPGTRDALVGLFDRELVEPQEAAGMAVVGQFRDIDDPDRFVWLRGFPDMPRRAEALHRFYGGPVWQRHRDEANATMIDSDDVHLLRPTGARDGFRANTAARPPVGTARRPGSVVLVTLCHRRVPVDDALTGYVDREVRPALAESGAAPLARFETEYAENTFPALPVRTGEHLLVWFSRFAGLDHLHDHQHRLARSRHWQATVLPGLTGLGVTELRQLRLAPTARSALR